MIWHRKGITVMLMAALACGSALSDAYSQEDSGRTPTTHISSAAAPNSDYDLVPELHVVDSLVRLRDYTSAIHMLSELLQEDAPETADNLLARIAILSRMASVYLDDGYYDSSMTYYLRADSLIRDVHGTDHPRFAQSLSDRGYVANKIGAYDSASSMLGQSIDLYRTQQGTYPPDALPAFLLLSELEIIHGDYDSAATLLEQARHIVDAHSKIAPADRFEYLLQRGLAASRADSAVQAQHLLESAIMLADSVADTLLMGMGRFQLAVHFADYDQMAQADSLSRWALELIGTTHRPNHPRIAFYLALHAHVMIDNLAFDSAQSMLTRARNILTGSAAERAIMRNILNAEVTLYGDIRDIDKAITLQQENIALTSELLGRQSDATMYALRSLATIHLNARNPQEAIPLLEETAEYFHTRRGDINIDYVSSQQHLSFAYYLTGAHAEAVQTLLAIEPSLEQLYQEDNSRMARHALFCALNYQALRDFDNAEEAYLKALNGLEQVRIYYDPQISGVHVYLATMYAMAGDDQASLHHFKRMLELRYRFMKAAYTYASAEQKLRYLRNIPLMAHSLISLALRTGDDATVEAAFNMLLNGKAVAIDALASENRVAQCSLDDDVRMVLDSLKEITRQISERTYRTYGRDSVAIGTAEVTEFMEQKEALEYELSRLCGETDDALMSHPVIWHDIVPHLPGGTALLDFVVYDPFDFDGAGETSTLFGAPHYAVFILTAEGEPRLIDLGPTADVDSLVDQARVALSQNVPGARGKQSQAYEEQLSDITSQLHQRLLAPVADLLERHETLFIATDGVLSLLPFEILRAPDSTYLIEKHQISYLSTSRDLLKFESKLPRPANMTVFFDPDYSGAGRLSVEAATDGLSQVAAASYDANERFLRGAEDCMTGPFTRLPNSQREVNAITAGLGDIMGDAISLYSDADAREETLKSLPTAPDILHLATHGFLCESPATDGDFEDLLLHSGLVLAGANRILGNPIASSGAMEDGILTAYEISGLNFVGTDLVTLSACETGLGRPYLGEGVFGLRRSFQRAGAESLLMSLWKIPDDVCADLMSDFYSRWLIHGETKAAAFRQASLAQLASARKQYGSGHPLLWGGFILHGNPY